MSLSTFMSPRERMEASELARDAKEGRGDLGALARLVFLLLRNARVADLHIKDKDEEIAVLSRRLNERKAA